MEKRDHNTEQDIASQRYKGASPIVAGLGESLLHSKSLLLTGAVLGGIAGAIFPTRVGKFMNECRAGSEKLYQSENHLVHGVGSIFQWLLKTGQGFVNFFRNSPGIKTSLTSWEKKDAAQRVATAINGAVVTSAGLSFVGLFTGIFSGARTSARGRHQFETAKKEIVTLRDSNTQLRDKLLATQFELDDVKTADSAKRGTLKVAPDDAPAIEPSDPINATPATHIDLKDLLHTPPQHGLTSDVALS